MNERPAAILRAGLFYGDGLADCGRVSGLWLGSRAVVLGSWTVVGLAGWGWARGALGRARGTVVGLDRFLAYLDRLSLFLDRFSAVLDKLLLILGRFSGYLDRLSILLEKSSLY